MLAPRTFSKEEKEARIYLARRLLLEYRAGCKDKKLITDTNKIQERK